MDYIELTAQFSEVDPWRDIFVSTLNDNGFESFVETKSGVQGYIKEVDFSHSLLSELEKMQGVESVAIKTIPDQNWNAKWEENFDPVLVEDRVAIRAPFHKMEFDVELVITIQPQMSFGTGHHETTWLMSRRLFELDVSEKSVLDMGTGTGVLAILAEKRGAKQVLAPDIDEWSFNNAQENCQLNGCTKIEVVLGGQEILKGKSFDVIAANINKNTLIEQFSVYSECLNSDGKLLISGFFETDQDDLKTQAANHGFIFECTFTKAGWAMMEFSAKSS